MSLANDGGTDRQLAYFGRSPVEQVIENLSQAIRVIELVADAPSELTPHPSVIARCEIENAIRYLGQYRDQIAQQ